MHFYNSKKFIIAKTNLDSNGRLDKYYNIHELEYSLGK